MTIIPNIPEKIHVQNTTFQKEYGEIVSCKGKYVEIKLFYKKGGMFPENTSFNRKFSKLTGKAVGSNLKILF